MIVIVVVLFSVNLLFFVLAQKAKISSNFEKDTVQQKIFSIENELHESRITELEAKKQKILVQNEEKRLYVIAKSLQIIKWIVFSTSIVFLSFSLFNL